MKKINLVLVTFIAALTLVSCGNSDPVSSPTTDSSVSSSSSSEETSYTVEFNSNGGTAVQAIEVDIGGTINKPTDPTKEGFYFVGWAKDAGLTETVTWPLTVDKSMTLYAAWNEKIPFKTYLATLIDSLTNDPYGYIPETMRPTNETNYVNQNQVTYDFNSATQVSNIRYGGFGEQWNMVIDNIAQSQRFYAVTTTIDTAVSGSVALFNNYFDSNTSNSAEHELDESSYKASISFANNVLAYSLEYKSNLSIPFFGTINPKIELTYNIRTFEKTVRIQLTEANALKYIVTENSYKFGIEYAVSAVARKAYFEISEDNNGDIKGGIYEFIQLSGKDVVPSCAEFYITDEYVTAVGNKASGMVGFKGYINELYETDAGKLIGYKVRETLTFAGISGTYNTLWFNLNNIAGIREIRAVENENLGVYGSNNHDIYLNGSSSIFTPAKNSKFLVTTSRKYDVELRKQYFYGLVDEDLVEYQTSVPMMFIQDDNSVDTNYSDFSSDMNRVSGIAGASVTLATKYLAKIRSDYDTYIDSFIASVDDITGESITQFIDGE